MYLYLPISTYWYEYLDLDFEYSNRSAEMHLIHTYCHTKTWSMWEKGSKKKQNKKKTWSTWEQGSARITTLAVPFLTTWISTSFRTKPAKTPNTRRASQFAKYHIIYSKKFGHAPKLYIAIPFISIIIAKQIATHELHTTLLCRYRLCALLRSNTRLDAQDQ